jgi:hypothetical protein
MRESALLIVTTLVALADLIHAPAKAPVTAWRK